MKLLRKEEDRVKLLRKEEDKSEAAEERGR